MSLSPESNLFRKAVSTQTNSHKPSDQDAAAEQMLQTIEELADRDAQIEDLRQQLGEANARLESYEQQNSGAEEQLKRTAADFQNFRRRTEQERIKWTENGRIEVITRFLDVYDDLSRSLEAAENATGDASDKLRQGIELIQRKFADEMEKMGVQPIEAVGEPFDVAQHDAMMQQPAPEGVAPGTVLQELQRGYRIGERVLRHSRVIVAS